jgi:hypothetical protein
MTDLVPRSHLQAVEDLIDEHGASHGTEVLQLDRAVNPAAEI